MMRVKIQLSDMEYSSKPTNAGLLTNEIEGKIRSVTIPEFAYAVGERGRAFTPAIFNGARKNDNFVSQEVYVLDFDDGMTIAEFMKRAKAYRLEPAIIYETFSSQKEHEKFRVVFINDFSIEERKVAAIMKRKKLRLLHFP